MNNLKQLSNKLKEEFANKIYHETEKHIYYMNNLTISATQYARKEDWRGKELKGYFVLLAEDKKRQDETF